jgi:phage tail sheath protein FI
MSDAGVEVLLFDANIGGFRFCNGLTTSKQLAKRYRSVVRTLDQVKTDLYLALQWCRSRPNTPQLQSEVASACDTYLYSKLRDGWFSNLQPTICSEANNTVRDQLEGRLNVRIRFTPSFPADTIIVSTIMDISDDFTIQTTI